MEVPRAARPGMAAALALSVAACGSVPSDPRAAVVVNVLESADDAFIRARPTLVAGKYATMSAPGISFFRGQLSLYLYDTENGSGGLGPTRFALQAPLVPCIGDPHPENFGTLLAADGTVALELDDFDTADRAPYLFDVRRFAAGLALAANLANTDDSSANAASRAAAVSIARAGIEGYVAGIRAAAEGHPPARVVVPTGSAYLDELLTKAAMGARNRDELSEDTVQSAKGVFLKRGVLDADDPQNVWESLPDFAYADLPAVLQAYRTTLASPPPPEFFTVLDAVREYGAGVSSWPKLRAIVLVQGSGSSPIDNEILEVKELTDSGIAGLYPPGLYFDNVAARDLSVSRAGWAYPSGVDSGGDYLWGGTSNDPSTGGLTWEGFPVQVRHETAAAKGLKVDDLNATYGTVQELVNMAGPLGMILARLHAAPCNGQPSAASAIWGIISTDVNGFEDEEAQVGASYAQQVLADLPRFQAALQTLGTSLGVPFDALDAPSPDLAALLTNLMPAPLPPTPPLPISP